MKLDCAEHLTITLNKITECMEHLHTKYQDHTITTEEIKIYNTMHGIISKCNYDLEEQIRLFELYEMEDL